MSRNISQPDAVPVVETRDPLKPTPVEFIGMFTPAEELGIREFADGTETPNKIVKIWLGRLEDPRVTEVDLAKESVRTGVTDLAALGLITVDRADEILRGLS